MRMIDRHLVFNNYWWIALVAGGGSALLAFFSGGEERTGLIGGVVATTLGFCYFVQQQKLAETHLFHQLFSNFNQRYDRINGRLQEMVANDEKITPDQIGVIVDYFNLCAEEYLFYKQGYIPRDVWRSWCRGMSWYLKRHPFKGVWNEEVKTESFYGLSLEVINEGVR